MRALPFLPLPGHHFQEPRLHFYSSLGPHLHKLGPVPSGAPPRLPSAPLALGNQPTCQEPHLGVSSFDVAQGALREFGQLRVAHCVHCSGARLSCQRLHLGYRVHNQCCLGPRPGISKGEADNGCRQEVPV